MATRQNRPARRHHLLPELLLKRFAKNGQVWVVDKLTQKSLHTNTSNAACVRDYYIVETTGEIGADCIEQGPLAEIESLAEPIISKMLKTWALPRGKDWGILVNFLALMYCRGPVFRAILKRGYEYGVNIVEEHIHSDEQRWKAIVGELCQTEGIDINYEEALRARKELEINIDIPNTYYIQEMLEFASSFVPVFAEMTPNIERVDTIIGDARFVISDCPIIPIPRSTNPSKKWSWFKNPDADLYFPISSKACLVLNYDKLSKVTNIDRRRAAFINHIMSLNSERVIVSEEQDFVWLRQNGTIALSHQELFEFLKSSPEGGPVVRLDLDSLHDGIMKALKQREIRNCPSE